MRTPKSGLFALLLAVAVVVHAPGRAGEPAAPGATAPTPGAFDPAKPESPLPWREDVARGRLDNGLSYVFKRNATPPGHVYLMLHIASGSMNETDKQRGIAHFLEHLAFNGSTNFKPGTLIPFFESLGLTFGRHQNASTGFDATNYILDLPKTDRETIDKGMTFLADVAGGLSLLPEEIDKERQIILEEKRARLSPMQRIFDESLPKQYPGSRLAARLPIGVEETILGVNRQDFVDYYSKWYTTGNMTLIGVGDADPELMLEIAESRFGAVKPGPRPTPEDPGVKPETAQRAVVGTDSELPYCGVEVNIVRAPLPPSTTVGDARRELVERIGAFAFNRRVRAKVDTGDMKFRGASASVSELFNALRQASIQAIGEPKDWRAMLEQLGEEAQRARLHGFTEREIDDARREMLSQAQNAVKRESTASSGALARAIASAVNEGEPFLSAQQSLDLRTALLPTITAEEVSAAFAKNFDPAAATFVLNIPTPTERATDQTPVPSEDEVLAVGKNAFGVTVGAEAERTRPERFMATTPTPGRVTEMSIHPATETLSAWLTNGTRMHHRFMDYRKNSATITITLAGGQIEETHETRGLTQAAMLAWSRPATRSLTGQDVRDLLIGKDVRVGGGSARDTISLTISGAPADLESGMQLAHLLLTEPKIESAAWDQWKQSMAQGIAARKTQPAGVMGEIIPDTLYPKDDPRMRALEQPEVEALRIEDAQRWLEGIIARAPIEVSVVGEIDRAKAAELIKTYVGSLKDRPRISDQTLANLRTVQRTPGPIWRLATLETRTPQAVVMCGFYGVDAKHVRDDRLLDMAAQILSTRMIKQVREEAQLVYSIRAGNNAAEVYPGFGVFSATAPTEPAKAKALAAKIPGMFGAFAADGPTEEEMAVARGQILNMLDESMKEPGFWSSALSDVTYRGMTLDVVSAAPEFFTTATREDVHAAFKKYFTPDTTLTFIVTPREPPETPKDSPPAP